MIKGSEIRKTDFLIEPLLLDRWSPRAMSGESLPQEELMRLFEAARWAPSSFNAQQWHALYAHREPEPICVFRPNFKSKQWLRSGDPGQRKCYRKNCKSGKLRMIGAK